jgi:hypothetical protein
VERLGDFRARRKEERRKGREVHGHAE